MQVTRSRLTVLFNALYDAGVDSIPVTHPASEIGELVRIDLQADGEATVQFTQGTYTYQDNREEIPVTHGEAAHDDLPDAATYARAAVASGLVDLENAVEVQSFSTAMGTRTWKLATARSCWAWIRTLCRGGSPSASVSTA